MITPNPTQVENPWRSTVRTVLQVAIGLATLIPFVAAGVYDDLEAAPAVVVQVLAAAAIMTRIMALPQVEEFLTNYLPAVAADPATGPGVHVEGTSIAEGRRAAEIMKAVDEAPPPDLDAKPPLDEDDLLSP